MARSLIGLMILGCASLPDQRAFIKILHALGANSPLVSSSSVVMDPSGGNGVAACLSFEIPVFDLYKSTVC